MQALKQEPEVIDLDSYHEEVHNPIEGFLTLEEIEAAFDDDYPEGAERLQRLATLEPPGLPTAKENPKNQYEVCLAEILDVFPDISHDYVRQLYDTWTLKSQTSQSQIQGHSVLYDLTMEILDTGKYPKERDRINDLKRKRSEALNSDEEEEAKWKDVERELAANIYLREARLVLQEEFGYIPSRFIDLRLNEKGNFFTTYLSLELAERTYDDTDQPPYTRLKARRRLMNDAVTRLEQMEANGHSTLELKNEIQAARNRRKKEDAKRQLERDAVEAEAAIEKSYRDKGDVLECQCCFDSYPMNKITHCDGDEPHFFCLECAESNAKNDIGNTRYKLSCMHSGGCSASFGREQRKRFLDAKSLETLERTQQKAELRLAQLQNFAACPFCDFAAICPPVEIDKEFRCCNPGCEKISCRICNLESHIPLTCKESKKENGISERHILEEARTSALLRTCPKCGVKILKIDGCNKVTCTCGGMLCDFCGKDISQIGYVHFDSSAAGITGNVPSTKCPTYDNLHLRRNHDLEKAEAKALAEIRAENPNIDLDDLKINFNEAAMSHTDKASGPNGPNPGVDHFRHPRAALARHGHHFPIAAPHVARFAFPPLDNENPQLPAGYEAPGGVLGGAIHGQVPPLDLRHQQALLDLERRVRAQELRLTQVAAAQARLPADRADILRNRNHELHARIHMELRHAQERRREVEVRRGH